MATSNLNRREFIGTTAMATGALAFTPAGLSNYFFGRGSGLTSAAYTPLRVKFIHTGPIHEETFEGSCRVGEPEWLTMEAETAQAQRSVAELAGMVNEFRFPPGIEPLETEGIWMWVERANPEIMLTQEELGKLRRDDPRTDVYVVRGGLPQYTCLRIAEEYNKPVVMANVPGWGLDAPAGLRARGYEGFFVQDMEELGKLLAVFRARKAIQNTVFLNVTNFDEVPKGVISSIADLDLLQEQYGMGYHTIDYKEFFSDMDMILGSEDIQEKSANLARELLSGASATNMTEEDVVHSLNFYLTVLHFLEKYDCNSFGIECFELCSSMHPWNRRFTPCLTHSLLKNAGFPSACEKDLNALLAMAVMMYISHKPAYMGNPDFDTQSGILTIHHSDSPTRMNGFDQPDDYYEIKSFTYAGFGASIRYDYERRKGQKITLSRFDPAGKKLILTSGEITGGGGMEGYNCAQTVDIKIPNCKEMQREMQNFGHHLSMVFGDWTDQVRDLGELMGFEVVLI